MVNVEAIVSFVLQQLVKEGAMDISAGDRTIYHQIIVKEFRSKYRMCSGITASGSYCSRRAKGNNKYCAQHERIYSRDIAIADEFGEYRSAEEKDECEQSVASDIEDDNQKEQYIMVGHIHSPVIKRKRSKKEDKEKKVKKAKKTKKSKKTKKVKKTKVAKVDMADTTDMTGDEDKENITPLPTTPAELQGEVNLEEILSGKDNRDEYVHRLLDYVRSDLLEDLDQCLKEDRDTDDHCRVIGKLNKYISMYEKKGTFKFNRVLRLLTYLSNEDIGIDNVVYGMQPFREYIPELDAYFAEQ